MAEREFVKISRLGERFWSAVVEANGDELTLRCDSDVIVRGLPSYGETFSASRREVIDRILVN